MNLGTCVVLSFELARTINPYLRLWSSDHIIRIGRNDYTSVSGTRYNPRLRCFSPYPSSRVAEEILQEVFPQHSLELPTYEKLKVVPRVRSFSFPFFPRGESGRAGPNHMPTPLLSRDPPEGF